MYESKYFKIMEVAKAFLFQLNCLGHQGFPNLVGIDGLRIWKYDEEIRDVQLHLDIPDIDVFLQPCPNGYINIVDNAIFANDLFVMATRLTMHDVDNESGYYFYFSTAIQIVDKEGTVLRQHLLHNNDVEKRVDFHLFNDKFFVEIEEEIFISQATVKRLFERPLVSYDDLQTAFEDYSIGFQRIPGLCGRSNLMISDRMGRVASIVSSIENGDTLSVKTLDFWSKV